MQIHELNNFTGTLGSGAYLAVDDGNDTGKLSTQQLLAATEARIDNIIAGPAPSAEEIVDARYGADGVTYPSLGDAIRDQVGDLKSELNLKNILSTGTFETGKMINGINGEVQSNAYSSMYKDIDVSADAGSILAISYYSYHYIGFAFYDSDHVYISGSPNQSKDETILEIVSVPANAKYLSVTAELNPNKTYVLSYSDSAFEKSPKALALTKDMDEYNQFFEKQRIDTTGTFELGKFVDGGTGAYTANANCKIIKDIDVSAYRAERIVIAYYSYYYAGFAFYDADHTFIRGSDNESLDTTVERTVIVPHNAQYLSVTTEFAPYYPTSYVYGIRVTPQVNTHIYSLNDALVAWMNGEKFPIAFYGDSTTDGWRTTNWVANELGADHTTGYLYTDVLQKHLRECCNNSVLRVYNAGFTGQSISWAVENFEAEFVNSGVAYSDVKMIGISFGINDQIHNKAEYIAFKNNLVKLIGKCLSHGIQPFLVTTQATYEADLASRNEAIANHTYANQAKKEVAKLYDLELIDTEKHTGRFIAWSNERLLDIIPDTCHFADAGHNFEGGMYFWQIVPRTIFVDEANTKITPYTIGITSDIPWRDGNYSMLYANSGASNQFKTAIQYNKGNSNDIKILEAWVYLNKPMQITPYFDGLTTQYVIVDEVNYTPSTDITSIGTFDMGLHHITVMSGTAETAKLLGLQFD